MQLVKRSLPALALATVIAAALAGAVTVAPHVARADRPSTATHSSPYKAPIVASLAPEAPGTTGLAPPRRGLSRDAVLSSPGGQLATTVAVFVFAMFLASLASRRR